MIDLILWILLVIGISSSALFDCDLNQCNAFNIGDLACTTGCSTAPCNFDSPVDCSYSY